MLAQENKIDIIRQAFPKEGLFAEKDWLLSPDAFPVDGKFLSELEQLGHRLFVLQRACNQLYQLSVKGKQPEWVARYLDAGKPKELIEFSRRKEIRDDLPRVIRPDLILTDDGYIIAEIDSVPGGIGLTGWLNQTYSKFDTEIIGDADGMGMALRIEICHEDGFEPDRELTDKIFAEGMKGDLDARGRRSGLVLDVGGYYKNVFTLAPCFDMTEAEIDIAVELFEQLIRRCAPERINGRC